MEWSAIERLNRERELVGIYLSAHPLDEYSVVLECMCNTHCSEISGNNKEEKIEELAKRELLTVGGIVTKITRKITRKGNPMGVIQIEDFDGQGEFALFDRDWATWQGMLSEGNSVFLKMRYQERFRGTGQYSLNIQSIDLLSEVAEKAMDNITINVNLDIINGNDTGTAADADDEEEKVVNVGNVLADLATIVKDSPGKSQLFLNFRDSSISTIPVKMRSRLTGIRVNRKLMDFIKSNPALSVSL